MTPTTVSHTAALSEIHKQETEHSGTFANRFVLEAITVSLRARAAHAIAVLRAIASVKLAVRPNIALSLALNSNRCDILTS